MNFGILVTVAIKVLIIGYICPMDAKLQRAPVDLYWKPVSLSSFHASKFSFVNDSNADNLFHKL